MSTIIGVTVGTPVPQSDWNQTDPNRADYIKNKPDVANALKGYAEGNPITLEDVSPVQHELKVIATREQSETVDIFITDLELSALNTSEMLQESGELVIADVVIYEEDGVATLEFEEGYSCTYFLSNGTAEGVSETLKAGDIVYSDYYTKPAEWKLYHRIKAYDSQITITIQKGDNEPETKTADENGNVKGIIGKGESMTLSAGDDVTISVEYNRDINKSSGTGGGGADGEDGATFIPSVSADCVISWTNDKGLANPPPVNIKGERGEQGIQGEKGDQGEDGYTPQKGKDYFTEADIAEIVNQVYDKIADGNGVSY